MHPSLSRIPGIVPPANIAFTCWIRINAFGQLPAKKTQFTLSARIDSADGMLNVVDHNSTRLRFC